MNQNLFINEFESENFDFDGINWWPFIKVQVSYQLHLLSTNNSRLSLDDRELDEAEKKIGFRDKLYFYSQLLKTNKRTKNLILTDNGHNILSSELKTNNPFTTPFIDCFNKFNINYTVFDAKLESSLLGFDLKILKKVNSRRVKKKFKSSEVFRNKLLKLNTFLKSHYGEHFSLYNHLARSIIINQIEYLVFLAILKRCDVKKVLLYCYYNSSMMSFIRACNDLNICSIEYQHSQVTSKHFAYSNWSYPLNNSQNFFPTKIWVWQESDANYLAKQFEETKNIDFIVGGNMMLALSKEQKEKKENRNIKILVTLQGIGLPDYIVNILENRPSLMFYLRLHPRYPYDNELCQKLKNKYGSQVEIEEANSKPLYELMSQVDYHLTCFSGSALEAMHFDLTNIIYGEKGYSTYKDKIDKNEFLHIKNLRDFDNIVRNRKKTNFVTNKIDSQQIFKTTFS